MTTSLIRLDHISLAFGVDRLLDDVKLNLNKGERVCLIGRNGAGKSSLLKIIEGNLKPDSGLLHKDPYLSITRLEQELPQQVTTTVYNFIAQGLSEHAELLECYYGLLRRLEVTQNKEDLLRLEACQQKMDVENVWALDHRINMVLTRFSLPRNEIVARLSGGWQRRAALARALIGEPQLLLLDEPTNHLDIEMIQWLENELISSNTTLLFITHDRALIKRLATRIIELDRGKLISCPGDYQHFLRRKEGILEAEKRQHIEFDKKLAQEERWIRQGIKARGTRNEGRVRALEALRNERRKRREIQNRPSFNLNEASRSGQLVIEAKNITQQIHHTFIIKDFSLRVMRNDRIGLMGPNGVGKSTLLNILLGQLKPDQGEVILGTQVKIAYFDQLRQTLDLEKSVIDNVFQGGDFVEMNGKKIHIMSYLAHFLFSPDRIHTPIKFLSGGECNRLLLARLFSKPSNLLVMDEPTNDLDLESLELLEELLSHYQGTILLVSHDRDFLDNVVTSTLVFEVQGIIQEFMGGYQDWMNANASKEKVIQKITHSFEKRKDLQKEPPFKKKLSYKEQKELSDLPKQIEELEQVYQELLQETNASHFYAQDQEVVTQTMKKLSQLAIQLEEAYKRWEFLEKSCT